MMGFLLLGAVLLVVYGGNQFFDFGIVALISKKSILLLERPLTIAYSKSRGKNG